MGDKAKDEVSKRYGRLTVLKRAGTSKQRHAMFLCLCDCGRNVVVSGTNLRTGNSTSCTCTWSIHGLAETAEYGVWANMKDRCDNPNCIAYPLYGERGITVCKAWQDSFEAFYEDMGPRPTPNHSIDRWDNDGNYMPENCRWATTKQQARNRRNTIYLTYQDKTQPLIAWAEEAGIKRNLLYDRIRRGWSVERALTQPVRGM